MALNLSPGEEAEAAQPAATIDTPATGADSAEPASAPAEQAATAPVSAGEGAAEAPATDATEQEPAAPDGQTAEGQPAAEEAQEASTVKDEASPAVAGVATTDDDAHDLLDELEALVNRAHHFENAGIERLRAGGLALIERIRNAI